jgi:hypothetical protein
MSESVLEEEERQAWLIGLASVVFDIDQGQTLEGMYPEGVISQAESRDVAFNSELGMLLLARRPNSSPKHTLRPD